MQQLQKIPRSVRSSVRNWTRDSKRGLLAISSHGDLYKNLLVAKAVGLLPKLREAYNPRAIIQTEYEFERR